MRGLRRRPFPQALATGVLAALLLVASSLPLGAVPVRADGLGPNERAAAQGHRALMLSLLNEMRSSNQLPQLRLNHPLSPESWNHSFTMARRDELFHTPDLASIIEPFGATVWGENIGVARTLSRLLSLMMASPPHRAHLVDPRLSWIGIGVVKNEGWFWVTLDLHN